MLQLMVTESARQHLLRHAPFGLAACSFLLDEYSLPRQDRERDPGCPTRQTRALPPSLYFSGVIGDCALPYWNGAESPRPGWQSAWKTKAPNASVGTACFMSTILLALMDGVSDTRTMHHSPDAAHPRHRAWLQVHTTRQGNVSPLPSFPHVIHSPPTALST